MLVRIPIDYRLGKMLIVVVVAVHLHINSRGLTVDKVVDCL